MTAGHDFLDIHPPPQPQGSNMPSSKTNCSLAIVLSLASVIVAFDRCRAAEPGFLASTSASPGDKVKFRTKQVDYMFRSEGAGVGDFDHDGKLDIVAGSVFYSGPKFV